MRSNEPVYLQPANVKDGYYSGRMTGHVLKWEYEGREVSCQTDMGVRGINCPVQFLVESGKVREDTIRSFQKTDRYEDSGKPR